MSPLFYLMIILGVCMFLYGACVMIDKHPLIPKYYKKTISKSYRFFIGKTLMLVSLSPVLCGLVSCLGDSELVVILSMVTLVGSFIGLMYIAIHKFKADE